MNTTPSETGLSTYLLGQNRWASQSQNVLKSIRLLKTIVQCHTVIIKIKKVVMERTLELATFFLFFLIQSVQCEVRNLVPKSATLGVN